MNGAWLLLQCATILFVFARVLGNQIPSCGDCCQSASHKKLNNSRRSVNSLWNPGQTPLCDNGLVSGWYRFTSFVGGKMPTTKVNVNHCGTQYPIWLDGTTGTHPTSPNDSVVHIMACINIAGTGGGCSYSFKVGVKLCEGNFFLYYLRDILGCPAAYCAGDGVPCPYGKTGSSLENCSAVPQKFPTRYLGYPVISAKDEDEVEEVSLWCNVSVNEKIRQWKNVTYQIEWYADGKNKKTDWNPKLVGENITSELSGKFSTSLPHYEPGQWISCTVKARYNASDQLHPWSDRKTILQPFFAGIKVTPSTLIITECEFNISKEITLTPMIPVRKNQDDQFLSVRFYLPEDLWLMSKTNCSIILQDTKSVTVKVGATCSPLRKKKDLITVITPVISNGARSTFWSRPLHGTKDPAYGLPTVWVTVEPVGQQLHKCMSVTDPHIRMLDELDSKKERWHDFFGYGDFRLYRNKERHFEVQTRQWECNRKGVTCNCGVIIRDHNDLISFSCCGSPPQYSRDDSTPIMVEIPRQKCLAPGITIRQLIEGINSKYEVIIPTGIKVILSRNYWGIDVTIITPRTKKPEDEDGLCTYKGTAPVITSLAHQYRLSSSYFEKLPLEINNKAKEFVPSCPCDEKKDQGQVNKDCTTDGIPSDWPSFGSHYNRIKMCDNRPMKGRKRRNIEVSDELTKEDYEFFMTPLEYNAHDRIRRSIVSKENATRYCAERLSETLVGKLCAKLGTNVQALVNVCSSDIEYTGDHSFAIGAVAILMNSCTDVIIKRMANKTSNVTKPTIPPTLQEVADLLCPNDCTFNGKCVNGSCVCNKDYTAKDCSISIYQRPSIARIQGKGLCDRRKRPCKKAAVQGRDFLDSPNMTCHIEEIEIVNSSWIPNRNEKKYRGIMTDLVLMECLLPDTPVLRMRYDETIKGTPAAGLMISVSNNGIDKSDQQLKMISFDSVCMDCNVSTGCSLKKNTCFINHYCFSPNEPNPRDWCQQCIPEVNTNTWTKRQVNLPPNVTSKINYYVVNGEKFRLPIEAIDPEGMSVTIGLLSGSPKDAFIQNNILYWNVTTNQTTHFFFSATDACGASSTFNFTATVNVCQCNNSGECIPQEPRGQGIYTCLCAAGYTGQYCNTEIDECGSYPCLQGRCIDLLNNYSCSCNLGFEGRNCDVDIDYCKSSPCVYGNCTDEVSGYTCNCLLGYSGLKCEVDIDECSSSPCLNNGTCLDRVNNYTCVCNVGYIGRHCDVIITKCSNDSCYPGVSCMEDTTPISCGPCPSGFTGNGRNCKDIDDCVSSPCLNGGSCVDDVNNFSCKCLTGFTGKRCETNIDDCFNVTCENGASCEDGINNFTCSCRAGYTGVLCETDIDDCDDHTCANNGSCVDGVNNYSCSCMEGYTGVRCEIDIDDCFNVTCENGASCEDGISNFTCSCRAGYTGVLCEKDIDDCDDHTCANNGSCVDGVNNYSCSCMEGYTGVRCEIDVPATPPTPSDRSNSKSISSEITTEPTIHAGVDDNRRARTPTKDDPSTNLPLIIGLSCGAFVLVVMFAIIVCYCTHSHVCTVAPPDEPCSRHEKYEMAPTITTENNPECKEQKGICNEGME
ncbi:von Willebrand factor D and EGF domain-containing protein-like isoform X2 [Montipora foliosa]|uniref:von Willebrand factor D and EGF domain-containing protein-like isoform X2 n=1 Tax=Montipora foliosa TaxID=591990 RepID=UPI0035F12170